MNKKIINESLMNSKIINTPTFEIAKFSRGWTATKADLIITVKSPKECSYKCERRIKNKTRP